MQQKKIADVIFNLLKDQTLNSGAFLRFLTLRLKTADYNDIEDIYKAVLIELRKQIKQDKKASEPQLTNVNHDGLIDVINGGLGPTPISAASIGQQERKKEVLQVIQKFLTK